MKKAMSIKNDWKLILKAFTTKQVFQRKVKSSIKLRMSRNKVK